MNRTIPVPMTLAAGLALCLAALPAQALAQSDGGAENDGLTDVTWAVTRVGPAPPATEQTVLFESDGGLVASSGCADYTGTYSLDGDALTVDSMRREFGSLQECTFGESGSADTFVNLMEAAGSWSIDEAGELSIEASGRYEGWTLTFEAQEASAAEDTADVTTVSEEDLVGTWRLEIMDLGSAGRATIPDEIEVTLTLTPDGLLSGSGGCSDYAGDFTVVGQDGIAITGVEATEPGTCDTDLADLQQFYLSLLPVLDSVEVEDGELVLGAAALGAELTYMRVE